jgi:hypothetical protein
VAPYNGAVSMVRERGEARRAERRKLIEQGMARMPQLVAEYRAARRLDMKQVKYMVYCLRRVWDACRWWPSVWTRNTCCLLKS